MSGSTQTGIYMPAANQIAIIDSGKEIARFKSAEEFVEFVRRAITAEQRIEELGRALADCSNEVAVQTNRASATEWIVERLRAETASPYGDLHREAADRIEELEAALRDLAAEALNGYPFDDGGAYERAMGLLNTANTASDAQNVKEKTT